MLQYLPKLFRHPEIMHDMITYKFGAIPPVKFDNWVRMNRMRLDTKRYSVPAFPYMLQIEPTNRCNLSCPICPCGRGELQRPPRDMKLSEFQGLIDDMGDYLLFLILWDWGEPFLNRDLPEMIRYAAERGIQTATSTNCHFLHDEDYTAAILRSGLTNLIVAVDSISLENYARYRQQGSVDKVIAGIENLMALKRKLGSPTKINLRMVLMRQNEGEIDQNRAFAEAIGADLFTAKTANTGYDANYPFQDFLPENPALRRYAYQPGSVQRIRHQAPCRLVWTMGFIQSNGNVIPCTRDFTGAMKIGNLLEQPFSQIWQGDAYRELRERIHNQRATVEKCDNCVDFSFKYSKTGWFLEVTDLPPDGRWDWRHLLRRRLLTPTMRTFINQVRRRL